MRILSFKLYSYRPFYLVIICLMTTIIGFSQTHLIFHKSHSGSLKSFDYLMNIGLLDNNSCGEGLVYDEEDRIVKFDSVKVIGKNQVVVFVKDKFKKRIIDTNYIENIQMHASENKLKKIIKNNYGASVSDKTTFIKAESQLIRYKNEKHIPTNLGGRRLTQLQALLSEDNTRLISFTNTTDIPIEFHLYLNSKIIDYHIRLVPSESKNIKINLFKGIENRLSFYLLSDDQTYSKMIYASLNVTDTKTTKSVGVDFSLGSFSSVQLSTPKTKNGSAVPTNIPTTNPPNNKGWWLFCVALISLILSGVSIMRTRYKLAFKSVG